MNRAAESRQERIVDRLAGRHLLVTGSTGFLAKAFVEKILRAVPEIGGLHLLIRRAKDGLSSRDRLERDVLRTSVFDRLRARIGVEAFRRLVEEKVHVVDGDLSRERIGLSEDGYRDLIQRIHCIVNSAATVTFDERLDWAIGLNTLGPQRLLEFAKRCGDVPFLHVSTCYVCGSRQGVVLEDFSEPAASCGRLPTQVGSQRVDLNRLVSDLSAVVESIVSKHGADSEDCRRELIEAGMRQASRHGWNDTYTFTKWIGEQLLIRDHGSVPLSVFRPAIIEGGYAEPSPGWIDGLRMADPIIVAYGRGKLRTFPGKRNIVIDLIPVDYVVNGMIAALPTSRAAGSTTVYQSATSSVNPLALGRMVDLLAKAFSESPMFDDRGTAVRPAPLRLMDARRFLAKWEKTGRRLSRWKKWVGRFSPGGRRIHTWSAQIRQIEQIVYFARIYSPYTSLDCRFASDNLSALRESLHPFDQKEFPFDPATIDWDEYIIRRHIPGLRSYVLGVGSPPTARLRRAQADETSPISSNTLSAATLYDVVARSAALFPQKSALQIQRGGKWIRYSYDDLMQASGAASARLREYGIGRGARVILIAENSPEWGVFYLGLMRAGAAAAPLDPQMSAEDIAGAAGFLGAKMICAGPSALSAARSAGEMQAIPVVELDSSWAPPPGAARDEWSAPVAVNSEDIASILFTSGTTVSPKAVPLTHVNLISNARALTTVHPIRSTDEFLSVLPQYHVFEFTAGFLVPLASGATITYVDQIKGPRIMSAMQATGTTVMLVVPRLLQSFRESIEKQATTGLARSLVFSMMQRGSDWSNFALGRLLFSAVHKKFGGRMRMFVCGGSRLDPDAQRFFQRMGFPVYEGYGLTETSPVLTVMPPGRAKPGSVGPPLPFVELEVRHPNLESIGEIWVKGLSVASGYLDNPQVNADAFLDGWFRTGDLGWRDDEGFLHLTGRSKDLIVTHSGKNVYPDEVELRYTGLPRVKEFCVLGMPAASGTGDVVHAVVVMDRESSPELDRSTIEREIRDAIARIGDASPSHQRIQSLHIWDGELPKTSTLKARRGVIRQMLADQPSQRNPGAALQQSSAPVAMVGPKALSEPSPLGTIRKILSDASRCSPEAVVPEAHLMLDLGIDSIGKIDVLCSVESQFRMKIDDETAGRIARVSDLLAVVGNRRPADSSPRDHSPWRRWFASTPVSEKDHGKDLVILPLRWMVRGLGAAAMHSYVRVIALGRRHIPAKGSFILAGNHSSHLDAPAILTAVAGRRRVRVAAAEDYFFNTPLKRLVFGRLLDAIAFDRQADGMRGLQRCGEALTLGDGLLLFPEGTRTRTGRMQPFKIGVAVLAVERGVPVIPVHIENSFELLRKGRRLPRPGTIAVRFGPPLHPPTVTEGSDPLPLFQSFTRQIQTAIEALRAATLRRNSSRRPNTPRARPRA